ncbi:MAG: flagellar hook-basal body protein [Eubacterium sp.]|nr:flagellar hook-basal body protein [Eubacterium sp.]
MMRSLWTAASGMAAQQTNLDTISNNLSNINTTGYKTEAVNFKSLIYQTLQQKSYDSQGEPKPVSAQVGLGVRSSAIVSDFTQGALLESKGKFDYAIQGEGFFMVRTGDGSVGYTRNGNFNVSLTSKGMALTDSAGNPVLNTQGQPIIFPNNIDSSKLSVDMNGGFTYPDANNNAQPLGIQMGLATFPNPAGLERTSDTILKETAASGTFTISQASALGSKVVSGYLEGSNVQAADEMVNMIIAQRAYEMNSKAIHASDEMLQTANNLRN